MAIFHVKTTFAPSQHPTAFSVGFKLFDSAKLARFQQQQKRLNTINLPTRKERKVQETFSRKPRTEASQSSLRKRKISFVFATISRLSLRSFPVLVSG